ncbi:unnamed protein product [Linum tenue]|uniref:Uncharacterized protein n=1 Tax=Linum tenue TaxID=586396 RepID=A0AAV0KZH3_9ROSI|nr:unnamed protein product [Linum tenue]
MVNAQAPGKGPVAMSSAFPGEVGSSFLCQQPAKSWFPSVSLALLVHI